MMKTAGIAAVVSAAFERAPLGRGYGAKGVAGQGVETRVGWAMFSAA
jgi:hypothetical protein